MSIYCSTISRGPPSCNVSVQHAVSKDKSCSRSAGGAGALSQSNMHPSVSEQHLECSDASWQILVIAVSSCESVAPIYLGVYEATLVTQFEDTVMVTDDIRACWSFCHCAAVLGGNLNRASFRDQHSRQFARRHRLQITATDKLSRWSCVVSIPSLGDC